MTQNRDPAALPWLAIQSLPTECSLPSTPGKTASKKHRNKPPRVVNRGAEPARKVFGATLFDALQKAVLGRVAYQLARYSGPDGADLGDQMAKRRLLEVWDHLAPEGLPLPSPQNRAALMLEE